MVDYLTKGAGAWNRIKIVSSTNGAGRAGQLHAKKLKLDYQLIHKTIHKNKLKMDKRLKYKSRQPKSPTGKQAGKFQIFHAAIFSPIHSLR